MSRREHFEQQALPGMPTVAPSTPSSAPQAPSVAQDVQSYYRSGEAPGGLRGRLVRQQVNRERVTSARSSDPVSTKAETFGMRPYQGRDSYGVGALDVSPMSAEVWRKHGTVKEVPLVGPDRPQAGQPSLEASRVQQLVAEPGRGSDPRFPGRELPTMYEHERAGNVVYNGHHRVAREMTAPGQGQMFTPARVISHTQASSVVESDRATEEHYSDSRALRAKVGRRRLRTHRL